MRKTRLAVAVVAAALSSVAAVYGAGYAMYEGSARGNAMGTEVTADPAGHPSVMFNNPAAITALEGIQVEAGMTLINPHQTVTTHSPLGYHETDVKSQWFTPPNAYVTMQMTDRIWFGLGAFCRYGLGVEYPQDWPGRYAWTKASLTSYDVNPNIAVKITENLSVAAGMRAEYMKADFRRMIPLGTPFASQDHMLRLKGDDTSLGFDVGMYWTPASNISFGASFQSRVEQELEGHATFLGQRYDVSADVITPAVLFIGTSLQPLERLKVNIGLIYTMWKSFEDLTIEFKQPLLGQISQTSAEKKWKNTVRPQVGLEYMLTDVVALRGGYAYEQTPDQDVLVDYLVPGNDRHMFSLGFGLNFEKVFFDAGYTYIYVDRRDVPARLDDGIFAGEFHSGDAHMISASIGYRF